MPSKKEFLDIVDFFDRWPDEREKMQIIANGDKLTKDQRDILSAMIFIIDCVGPNDLAP